MRTARMITATTIPNTDVTYDAIPRSLAVLVACGSPSDSLRRANTIQYISQNTTHSLYNPISSLAFCCRAQPCYSATGGVSVRLSIRPLHTSIDSKLMTVGSRSFHHR